ncbi:MAG: glycosyltransferase [bacterium]|nr:glycosyltransferase [bacterium]
MKILVINRPNAFSQRGGDSELMEKITQSLVCRGVVVDFDLEQSKDPAAYDLCHIYNFATPEISERAARRCHERGVPYVVTTLYEDRPVFFNQMHYCSEALFSWVESGGDIEAWNDNMESLAAVSPAPRWENSWTAHYAAALLVTGDQEKRALVNDYGQTGKIHSFHMGSSYTRTGEGGRLFSDKFGVENYVLLVGRLETRKNQLMLLKALEDSELPVVLAAGGFTYQPEYENMCRRFPRRGQTIITGRLDEAMLHSAYEGATVHALPSWYELPGIVSLEAARCGAAVVVSDHGTARDYFGADAWYCQPGNADSIRSAVYAAYYSPRSESLAARVSSYTWESAAEETLAIYQMVITDSRKSASSKSTRPGHDITSISQESARALEAVARISLAGENGESVGRNEAKALSLCDAGDELARDGQYIEAERAYREAQTYDSRCHRAVRGRAVVCMLTSRNEEAEQLFRLLLEFDATDAKSLAGLATTLLYLDKTEEAYYFLTRAANVEKRDPSVLLHLTNAAYALGRYEELADFLGNLISADPLNGNLFYSLAGCHLQMGELSGFQESINQLVLLEGNTVRVQELKSAWAKREEKGTAGRTKDHLDLPQQAATGNPISTIESLKMSGDFEKAAKLATDSLSESSIASGLRDNLHCLAGESLGRLGLLAEALEHFRAVSPQGEFGARALTGAGAVESAASNWPSANAYFQEALQLNGNSDNALAGLGMCSAAAGNPEAAWDYYLKSLEINPENLRALYGVIELGYRFQRFEDVEKTLRNYLSCHPADVSILYSLAGCLYAQEEYHDALQEIRKVILLKPDYEIAVELKGKIEQKIAVCVTKSCG